LTVIIISLWLADCLTDRKTDWHTDSYSDRQCVWSFIFYGTVTL